MRAEKRIFRNYLRENGLRFTPEREHILEAAVSHPAHFDADELHLQLQRHHGRISKASIYRTIPLLIKCSLIRNVGHHNGRYYYEISYGHANHCHLRCISCGKIVDITVNNFNKIGNNVGKEHGYVVTGYRLEFHGYCSECSRLVENRRISSAYISNH